jgi:hypothetical protein
MVETGPVHDVQHRPRRAYLWVIHRVDQERHSGQHQRAGAHETRFQGAIDGHIDQVATTYFLRWLAQGQDLRVGGGVPPGFFVVVPPADDASIAHCYSAHGVTRGKLQLQEYKKRRHNENRYGKQGTLDQTGCHRQLLFR